MAQLVSITESAEAITAEAVAYVWEEYDAPRLECHPPAHASASPRALVGRHFKPTGRATRRPKRRKESMKLYQTRGAAFTAGARDAVPVVTHATARAAYRRGVAAAEAIPEAHNRQRHAAKEAAISAYIKPRAKYADAADVAEAIAGKPVHYLHRRTVNLGSRKWSDYRPEYEEHYISGIILEGTASASGKSVNRVSIAHFIIVKG